MAYHPEYLELRKVTAYEDKYKISATIKTNAGYDFLVASWDKLTLVSDPVDTSTGAFTTTIQTLQSKGVTDLSLPLGYYSALVKETGTFGKGWETEYDAKMSFSNENAYIQWTQNRANQYKLKEGSYFEYVGIDPSTIHDTLVITDLRYNKGVLTKKDGTKWTFSDGYLVEVTDRTGRTFTLVRGMYNKLSWIQDNTTGKKIKLEYDRYLINVLKLIDDTGREVNFTYTPNNYIESITDPNGNKTTYEYDENGRIISSHDHEGNRLFLNTYDDKGRVIQQENNGITTFEYNVDEEMGYQTTTVTDRNGNQKHLVHNTELKLIKIIDENGDITEKAHDQDGNLIEQTDQNGNKTYFTYDNRGNVLTSTDAKGTITEFTYDENDNLTSTKVGGIVTGTFQYENNLLKQSEDRFGNKTTYTYNNNAQIETTTNADGGITTYTYENGLLKTITDPTGVVTTYEHDNLGRLIATIDGNNNRTELTYDNNNNLIKTKDTLGNESSFEYDSRNRKTKQTDNKGNVTTYVYDTNNNLISTTDALGNTITHEYDLEDRLIATIDALNNRTEFIRDEAGQIIAVKDPLGNTVSTTYDKAGNILQTKDAYNNVTSTTEYDELNRPTKHTDALGNQSITQYNEFSDITETVNALNQRTQFEYYNIGMLNKVTDANNGVTEQSYDNMNHQSSFTDANGNTTSFTYDLAGRTTSVTLQNGSTVAYEYNNLGFLSKTTNARGQEFTYEYDQLGRLIKTIKLEGVIETTYDQNGNIVTKSDENGTVSYEYDELNKPTAYTDVFGNHIEYTYDKNSNLTELKYPDGKTVTYTYNANNQLETVTDWANRTTTYFYDKNGRLIRTDRPNGTYETRDYDIKGQLTKLGNYKSDSSVLQETTYEYNALGVILTETTTDGTEPEVKTYTYDDLNRVVNVNGTTIGDSNYTYDAQGNLLESSKDSLVLGYGDNNWLTTINETEIDYDADGNALQTTLNDTLVNLTYDSLNRLTQAGSTTYRYDVNNNRIEIQDQDNITQFVVNPISQYSQVLVETDETGKVLKRYIYGIGLIGEETLDNNYLTYHYDYRGSITLITDTQGETVEEFKYDTYGELLVDNKGYRFLYNGRDGVQTDSNGLYYMRARYYNPVIKRFINQDILLGSIFDSTSLNRYSYVNGNPVNLVDPFGLEGQSATSQGFTIEDALNSSNPAFYPMQAMLGLHYTVENINKADTKDMLLLSTSLIGGKVSTQGLTFNKNSSNYFLLNKTHKNSMPKPKGFGPNGGKLQSHHGLQQQWAKQNLASYGYNEKLAPTVTLETAKGLPHTLISNAQNARRDARIKSGAGKWSSTLQEELQYIVEDFASAGFTKEQTKQVMSQQYRMLDKLGVPYRRVDF